MNKFKILIFLIKFLIQKKIFQEKISKYLLALKLLQKESIFSMLGLFIYLINPLICLKLNKFKLEFLDGVDIFKKYLKLIILILLFLFLIMLPQNIYIIQIKINNISYPMKNKLSEKPNKNIYLLNN
jgi:hypothetical protein